MLKLLRHESLRDQCVRTVRSGMIILHRHFQETSETHRPCVRMDFMLRTALVAKWLMEGRRDLQDWRGALSDAQHEESLGRNEDSSQDEHLLHRDQHTSTGQTSMCTMTCSHEENTTLAHQQANADHRNSGFRDWIRSLYN